MSNQKLIIEDNLLGNQTCLELARKGGYVHKQVKQLLDDFIKPNMKLVDICKFVETNIRELTEFDPNNPTDRGIAFPVGVSINNCAAHWTPNPRDNTILKYDDVLKVDFGVHYNGYIIDSAFTKTFNPKYNPLIEAAKDATNTGVKLAGNDAILGEIGAEIQEVIESYEIELDGKTTKLKSIYDLSGHQISQYKVHGKKAVPLIKIDYNERMKAGEFFAIETFPSTGTGKVNNGNDISHYMINYQTDYKQIPLTGKEKRFLKKIETNFSTLAFCKRWLSELNMENYQTSLKALVDKGVVNSYPPLYDIPGSYVAQFEHTIYIGDSSVEVLSKGNNY